MSKVSPNKKSLHRSNTWLLLITSILISAIAIYSYHTHFNIAYFDQLESTGIDNSDYDYGVIVDCGSTGSRAHIFKWPTVAGRPRSLHEINLLRDGDGKLINKHISPGLSSFKDRPEEASNYMDEIMRFLNVTIPNNRQQYTYIHFLATAGMRLLDKHSQRKIFDAISKNLAPKYNFPLLTKVISGRIEGAFSWLSLNAKKLLSDIQDDNNVNQIDVKTKEPTYGIIELGGASAQVTYEVVSEIEQEIIGKLNRAAADTFRNEQFSFNMRYNESYRLFSTTFLGLGVSSARLSAIDLLLIDALNEQDLDSEIINYDTNTYNQILEDPCISTGLEESISRPKLLLQMSEKTNFVGKAVSESSESLTLNLRGTGDFNKCQELAARVLALAKSSRLNCEQNSRVCPMEVLETEFIPFLNVPFVGLSEFFFTTNEMMNLAGEFNASKVQAKTEQICSSSYEELQAVYPPDSVSEPERLKRQCFKATWLLTLLTKGFKLPKDYKNFITVEQMDDRVIDWTIGAMMKKAIESSEKIQQQKPQQQI